MSIYTVHEPPVPAVDAMDRSDELVFVREGFSWLALFFPLIWLIYHRAWMGLALFIGVSVLLNVVFFSIGLSEAYSTIVFVLLSLVVAFEGNNLRRWQLDMRDYKLIGSVTGRNLRDCELKFYSYWTQETAGLDRDTDQVGEGFIPGSPIATANLGTSSL